MTNAHGVSERLVPGSLAWELYMVEHQQRYEFFAPQCRGLRVLDAACGVGYGTQILREHGTAFVVGIDLAFDAAAYGASHYGTSCTPFLVGNVETLPFDSHIFDVAVSFETLEHVPHPAFFLDEVKRVLKPNGLFIGSTPNRDFVPVIGSRPHNPYHTSEMTLEEFKALVRERFNIIEQYYQSHSPSFLRHIELLQHIETMNRPLRFSRFLRFENTLRRLLGYSSWSHVAATPPHLARAVSGDFFIDKLQQPSSSHLTFILQGRSAA